jgi:hypothetical protein
MFSLSYDERLHVLVGFAGPGARADADYERVVTSIAKLDEDGARAKARVAFVLVIDAGSEAPPPVWRKRLAEQRKTFKSPAVFMAIVSPSALTRGVLTAMNWISPPPEHVQTANPGTIGEAAVWVERQQGTTRGIVQRMAEETRARVMTRSA